MAGTEQVSDDLFVLPQSALDYAKTVTAKRGHAGHPGRGPEGETCGSCLHRTSVQGGRKAFSKCKLNERNWTRGPGSDIKMRDPACELWAPNQDA